MLCEEPCPWRIELRPADIMKCVCGGKKKGESVWCVTATLLPLFSHYLGPEARSVVEEKTAIGLSGLSRSTPSVDSVHRWLGGKVKSVFEISI